MPGAVYKPPGASEEFSTLLVEHRSVELQRIIVIGAAILAKRAGRDEDGERRHEQPDQ